MIDAQYIFSLVLYVCSQLSRIIRMIVEFLLFATLSAAQVISANYKTFKEDVLDSPHVTMVKFYARKLNQTRLLITL